ncbi:MAG: aminopeptidase [Anaerorhabdus sp.]
MEDKRLREYAKLAIKTGVNIQKGQLLIINAAVTANKFAEMCTEEAYKAGASEVKIKWYDDYITKLTFENVDTEILKDVPQYKIDEKKYEIDRGCAYLSIRDETPGNLKDVPSDKLQAVTSSQRAAFEPFRYYTMANEGQWCIVGHPNPTWAKKIFPDLNEDDAVEALWNAILKASRVDGENDPIEAWVKHNANIKKYSSKMNEYSFKTLHFTNGLGTDLYLDLAPNHIWAGGCDKTSKGVQFNPNIPTEEVFTAPRRTGVNGIVYGTKPLNYQGKLIEEFWIKFKDGKAVEFSAKKEESALKNLIDLDEGSSYLGEVALISHFSPISEMNILFYNTLYDENASCHLALGAAYPTNVVGGKDMSKEDLVKNDVNVSMAHSDFMFGSHDMKIVGIKDNGEKIQVFENGSFCI